MYEPKWDGYRAIVTVSGGEATFTSRRGNDLTQRFAECARRAAPSLRSTDAVLDGEICALDEQGRSRFSLLQGGRRHARPRRVRPPRGRVRALVDVPLGERRERLEGARRPRRRGVLVSPQFDDGEALLAAAREQGLEGVVAKRADSPYRPGRRVSRLAQGQGAAGTGARDRRLHERSGRRTGGFGALVAGGQRGGWAALGGKRRHGVLRRRDRAAARSAETARAAGFAVRRDAEDAADPEGRRRLGGAVSLREVEFVEWTHEGRLRAPVVHRPA